MSYWLELVGYIEGRNKGNLLISLIPKWGMYDDTYGCRSYHRYDLWQYVELYSMISILDVDLSYFCENLS